MQVLQVELLSWKTILEVFFEGIALERLSYKWNNLNGHRLEGFLWMKRLKHTETLCFLWTSLQFTQNHWSSLMEPINSLNWTILPHLNTLSPCESLSIRLSPLKFQILPSLSSSLTHCEPPMAVEALHFFKVSMYRRQVQHRQPSLRFKRSEMVKHSVVQAWLNLKIPCPWVWFDHIAIALIHILFIVCVCSVLIFAVVLDMVDNYWFIARGFQPSYIFTSFQRSVVSPATMSSKNCHIMQLCPLHPPHAPPSSYPSIDADRSGRNTTKLASCL